MEKLLIIVLLKKFHIKFIILEKLEEEEEEESPFIKESANWFTKEEMSHLENFKINPNSPKDRTNKIQFKAFNENIYLPKTQNINGKDIYKLLEEIEKSENKKYNLDELKREHDKKRNEEDIDECRKELFRRVKKFS